MSGEALSALVDLNCIDKFRNMIYSFPVSLFSLEPVWETCGREDKERHMRGRHISCNLRREFDRARIFYFFPS
jgi:hypothetical protein